MTFDVAQKNVPDLKTLRAAVPPHCFRPKLATSLHFIIRDILMVAALAWIALWIPLIPSLLLRVISWNIYGFVQGLVFTGVWILAHECGHMALFDQALPNNVFGFFLHSFLLVPFFSWKYSHARHHRYTNNMAKDTVFVPPRANSFKLGQGIQELLHQAGDSPFLNAVIFIGHQILGWPLYILFNITAGKKSSATSNRSNVLGQSHLDPTSDLFASSERLYVLISDCGLLFMAIALYQLGSQIGPSAVIWLYWVPYLWVNHWLALQTVAITFLHHTHPSAAHYEDEEWTFAKGALSTVDREFGFIGRHIFHGIIEYHVIHHLFPRIPFYHAEEATESIQALLETKYIREKTSFIRDLWTTFTSCQYVVSTSHTPGILVWTSKQK